MDSFDHPVALWVVRSRSERLNAQGGKQLGPESGHKLRSLVSSDVLSDTEASYPVTEKGSGTVTGSDAGERNSFQPSGVPVHDCKQVAHTLGLW